MSPIEVRPMLAGENNLVYIINLFTFAKCNENQLHFFNSCLVYIVNLFIFVITF